MNVVECFSGNEKMVHDGWTLSRFRDIVDLDMENVGVDWARERWIGTKGAVMKSDVTTPPHADAWIIRWYKRMNFDDPGLGQLGQGSGNEARENVVDPNQSQASRI
ncbi:hypothetical protein PPTG_24425 [Phytophthora nicotianae INRA-310]|uniref:Uncharacterized protein n=2 Tax=Phytophthora nicotianae TaxID=4792 RepID=W2PEG5_PHYN3|nr:hypothetical protein PPTG_24425 [Phytophthora nicotianae INRA-310]ETM99447.1 hypothetical protein PPTG_24425 [Phytophthora nicotianae INRA-310]